MKRLIYFIIFITFLLSSCSKLTEKKDNVQTLKMGLNNRDHVIALQDNRVCYAKYRNIRNYEIYLFDDNESLLSNKICSYIKDSKKKKIYEGMNKSDVTEILGAPAIIDGNRFIYFQNYIAFSNLRISYGIDRRIFEIRFNNDVVIQVNEKYVSRY